MFRLFPTVALLAAADFEGRFMGSVLIHRLLSSLPTTEFQCQKNQQNFDALKCVVLFVGSADQSADNEDPQMQQILALRGE